MQSKSVNKTKFIILLVFLFSLMLLTVSFVSAANVTVNNTWTIDDIQNLVDGNQINGETLNEGDDLLLSEGNYTWNKGLHINKTYNIKASGKVRIIGSGINLTKPTNQTTIGDFGLHITANYVNVTGISIEGFYYGISIDSSSNVRLTSNNIHDNRRGVNAIGTNIIIENNTILDNAREGTNLNGESITIRGNVISGNGYEAIHGHAKNSVISNNTIQNNRFVAVDFHYHTEDPTSGDNVTFENNIISNNRGGVYLNVNNAKIINNQIYDNGGKGIVIKAGGSYVATNNTISNNRIYNNAGNGIEVNYEGNTISNNDISRDTILDNVYGIYITVNNVNVTGSSIKGFYYGISINNSSNIRLSSNNIHNNRRGVNSIGTNILIEYNQLINNLREGINFNGESVTLNGNIISGNGFEGIHGHAKNSVISGNILQNNGFGAPNYGLFPAVDLHGHNADANNMTFINNIVNNNGAGVYISISNAKITNNQIYNNLGEGIIIGVYSTYPSTGNIVNNNRIYNNIGNGIEVRDNGNTISSNDIFYNSKTGIVISSNASNTQITGNFIHNNAIYGIENIGASNKIINNKINDNTATAIKNTGSKAQITDNTINGVKQVINKPKTKADLSIAKVKRSGNNYIVTIKNNGKTKSSATKIRIYFKIGKKIHYKIATVKAINPGKSVNVIVKFYKYSAHKKYTKTVQVNYNKKAIESNYKNNSKKIKL
ncbi:hypothetical protein MBCUT_05050 [Methanobrevibacter cuticularis]|uniref:Right handed beta helix domain-containing protein n=1 Tax=Methanobrevibacter cuticularis TaxID=47311 RepID=A0A166EPN9_9EURY|nr:right-handed parallel beta-helix repeat-containing protein [Methanobrevibacter cuticularis]KZX16875.1 hypothetical protein MBCUT_05050 [Methanobrevibacter cuticularis]